MRTAKPLTTKEKVQLDDWNEKLDVTAARTYVPMGVLGFVGGAGMSWWLTAPALAAGGSSTITDDLPFLRGVEAALGPLATSVLLGGVLFAAGMLFVAWKMLRSMRAMRSALQARYIAAGADGEPSPAEAL